jgi:predicted PurR-regulated permease PerM
MQYERHFVFWIGALIVFVALLWLLSPILLPFVLGMALAYALDPLAKRLTRRGVSRLAAALIILGGFAVAFVALVLIIAPVLAQQVSSLKDNAPAYAEKLQGLVTNLNVPWLKNLFGDTSASGDSTSQLVSKVTEYFSQFLVSIWTTGRALISIFSLLIITPVVAFYLICDWDRMITTLDRLIPLSQRDTVRSLCREIDATLSAYVRGQSAVCLILGSYYAVVLTLTGLSFGLLIGIVSGLISFIPYVGSLTALIMSLGVAAAQPNTSWAHVVIVGSVVLVGQFAEGYVLAPNLVGHSVGLHPVWLMFALFAFGYLFGFVGLVLAVPLAAAAGVLTRFAVRRYRESPIYTGIPSA